MLISHHIEVFLCMLIEILSIQNYCDSDDDDDHNISNTSQTNVPIIRFYYRRQFLFLCLRFLFTFTVIVKTCFFLLTSVESTPLITTSIDYNVSIETRKLNSVLANFTFQYHSKSFKFIKFVRVCDSVCKRGFEYI